MESLESKPESYQDRVKRFGNFLLDEGLAVEVRQGLNLNAADYEYAKGDEFAVKDAVGVICRFLSLPLYIDDFESHEVRTATFSKAKLPSDLKELYFHNKLRTNRLNAVRENIETLSRMRGNPLELNIFLKEQVQVINLENYAELTLQAKLVVVSQIEQLAAKVLNKMIEMGVIFGPTVTSEQ